MDTKEFSTRVYLSHMGHIQSIISNMTYLSVGLKLSSALVFCFVSNPISSNSMVSNIVSFSPLFVFWLMDAYFLKIGRLYRKKYETKSVEIMEPFSSPNIEITGFHADFNMSIAETSYLEPFLKVLMSKTLFLFYVTLISVSAASMYLG